MVYKLYHYNLHRASNISEKKPLINSLEGIDRMVGDKKIFPSSQNFYKMDYRKEKFLNFETKMLPNELLMF
jgi:hypothetical protein